MKKLIISIILLLGLSFPLSMAHASENKPYEMTKEQKDKIQKVAMSIAGIVVLGAGVYALIDEI